MASNQILFLKREWLFNVFPNIEKKVIKSATKKEICFVICLSYTRKSKLDTVQPCDTTQVRSDSNFGVQSTKVQVYRNSYNSQSNCWIELKFYVDTPDMFSYYRLKFQVNQTSRRHHNTSQYRLYEFCYLLPFDLWTSFLVRILFLQGCGSWFWKFPSSTRIFNELQCNLQVWQGFINVQNPFLMRIPYSS